MFLSRLFASSVACLFAVSCAAHEFWLEPQQYQVTSGMPIVASLKNGENFRGTDFAWFDRRILRFDAYQNGNVTPVTGRAGDVPAVRFATDQAGLVVFAHEAAMQTVAYRDWQGFVDFATHKGYANIVDWHKSRALPEPPFEEGYRRFVKSLVAVGDGAGQDQATGLLTEFVALANPYRMPPEYGLPVQLLYKGQPRQNALIEVFERAPDGTVGVFTVETDATGQATIPIRANHSYLLDSVVLRPPSDADAAKYGIVWESLWASLTFHVPK
ncbi:DUF4198 domain-containing protein [Pelagimonas sp. KU-00592-HH]|uniref:DUF4198 domain-containing protein n=1 Tax=Pelagimonas sp. KU-00592-HH TaxID=3127651 RepID=UPI0031021127